MPPYHYTSQNDSNFKLAFTKSIPWSGKLFTFYDKFATKAEKMCGNFQTSARGEFLWENGLDQKCEIKL